MNKIPWNKGLKTETKYPQLRDKKWLEEQLNRTSMRLLAKEIGCSYKRVYDAREEMGIVQGKIIRVAPESPYPVVEQNKDEIVSAYKSGSFTTRELSKKYNVPQKSMTYYLHRKWNVGLPLFRKTTRPDGRVVTKEEIESVYFVPGVSSREASKRLKISVRALREFRKKYGIDIKKRESTHPQLRDVEWLTVEYIHKDKPVSVIAEELGVSIPTVRAALRYIPFDLRKSRVGNRMGDKAANWKGGKRYSTKGYVYVHSPKHPASNLEGYVMEHRLVMEEKLGRYLTATEVIHHINGQKNQNNIENLELVSDRGAHTKKHFTDSHKVEGLEEALRAIDPNHPLLTNS